MNPEAQQRFETIVRDMSQWLHSSTDLPNGGATLEQLHWIRGRVSTFVDTIPVLCQACRTLYHSRNIVTDEAGVTFCCACWERDQVISDGQIA